jgi:formate-dependent nitrite reductase cytochrome c552 subunit
LKKIKFPIFLALIILICSIFWVSLFSQVIFAANDAEKCKNCHQEAKKTWEKSVHGEKGINCLMCHKDDMKLRQSREKVCVRCHSTGEIKAGGSFGLPQKEVFEGVAALWVEKELSTFHTSNNESCVGCHMTGVKDHTFEIVMPDSRIANRQEKKEDAENKKDKDEKRIDSCTSCHTVIPKKLLQRQLNMWQMSTEKLLKKAKNLLEEKKEFKDLEVYQKAKTSYLLAKKDGSKGAHNPYYIRRLLGISIKNLDRLKEKKK